MEHPLKRLPRSLLKYKRSKYVFLISHHNTILGPVRSLLSIQGDLFKAGEIVSDGEEQRFIKEMLPSKQQMITKQNKGIFDNHWFIKNSWK